jgi:cytochrome o ubiquinol oxidase subunit 2
MAGKSWYDSSIMGRKYTPALIVLLTFGAIFVCALLTRGSNLALLNSAGWVAGKERNLMITAVILMLLVVIPVFILTFAIVWKYRADNTKARYTPDWDHHNVLEAVWWGIPFVIILTLSIIAWNSSHELDPFRPLDASAKPITVQVVALQWKWLFIYPEQHIASVNFFQFPENTPVNFVITSDAPMNSFWIPQLAGQIYAMPGMSTELHAIADRTGDFAGVSSNISGEGFAGMKFVARSSSQGEFDRWIKDAQQAPNVLDQAEYSKLSQPSSNDPVATFAVPDNTLYDDIVMKYMMPGHDMNASASLSER